MGMFFDIRRPSLWVHFQTPNTHIRAFHTGVAPPGVTFTNYLSPYYTMRFPYVALAIKPNTNEMNMHCK